MKRQLIKRNIEFEMRDNTYILSLTRGELMSIDFSFISKFSKVRISFKNDDSERVYKFLKVNNLKQKYININTEKDEMFLFLNGGANPFFCMSNMLTSMPHNNNKTFVLIPDFLEISDINYSFSEYKEISEEQKNFDIMAGIKTISDGGTNLTYCLKGKQSDYSRIIVSFPSVSLRPSTFKMYDFHNFIDHDTDLVIAFSDRYGSTGSYLLRDDYLRNIEANVLNIISKLIKEYKTDNQTVIFTGISKGGFIANHYAKSLDVDIVSVSCPQMTLLKYIEEIKEQSHYNSLNFLYFLRDISSKEYKYTDLNGKEKRYLYSPLDQTSDCGVGSENKMDMSMIVNKSHNDVSPFGKYKLIPLSQKQDDEWQDLEEELTLIKLKNSNHLLIEVTDSIFSKNKDYSFYAKFEFGDKEQYEYCDFEVTPEGHLISNGLDNLIIDFTEKIQRIKWIECFEHGSRVKYKINISKVKKYIFDKSINNAEVKIRPGINDIVFKVESSVLKSTKLDTLRFVCDGKYYNKLTNVNKLEIEFDRKTIEPFMKKEMGMLCSIEEFKIYIPLLNEKH